MTIKITIEEKVPFVAKLCREEFFINPEAVESSSDILIRASIARAMAIVKLKVQRDLEDYFISENLKP